MWNRKIHCCRLGEWQLAAQIIARNQGSKRKAQGSAFWKTELCLGADIFVYE
jgi:hypothetical protein